MTPWWRERGKKTIYLGYSIGILKKLKDDDRGQESVV